MSFMVLPPPEFTSAALPFGRSLPLMFAPSRLNLA
jgi:hypothetical protein